MTQVHATTPEALAAALGVHPLVAAVLIARGCTTPEQARAFLDPAHYVPISPFALPDMDRAVAVLREAIANRATICVWGDFDVDGQTATSVLLLGLRALGGDVFFYLPSRQQHGHGLNEEGLRAVRARGAAVLLTCDCGVSDFEAVRLAKQLGLRVVITDHHDPVREDGALRLPDAEAVVNPKRLPSDHPLIHLPGVGVAYKLVEALLGAKEAAPLLDLVALGIVADVAWQQGETRYLLQRGLEQLRRTQRVGLQALARSAGVTLSNANEDVIGFQLGPRLNAAGRLSTADRAVTLLTTQDEVEAEAIASELELLNLQRRQLQSVIEEEALAMLQRDAALAQAPVIVLSSPNWHVGLIGIAASALVSRLGKPVILISTPPGQIGRGSARSVEGVDIHAAIAAQAHLLEESGGHPMAAGFSIRSENIAAFRQAICAYVASQGSTPAPQAHVFTVAWRDVNLALADQLEQLAPFGAGNPRPLLRTDGLRLVRAEPLGADGKHRALFLQDAQGTINRALWWRSSEMPLPEPEHVITLLFTLRRERFNERTYAQIVVHALTFDGEQRFGEPTPALNAQFLITDLRAAPDRLAALHTLLDAHGASAVQVCSVMERPHDLPSALAWHSRAQLTQRPLLVVWDAPPGPREFAEMLRRAEPQHVALLCTANETADEAQSVITQVLGMIKVAQRRGDALDDPDVIARMAARINQREDTVRAVIRWHLGEAKQREVLRYLLAETRAYRRYVCEAPAEDVLRLP
ncbi:MAG: single-stranded-DNA-specific exonuclease RecJ [Thermoflexales bacterium]|nr:single-stranded-DNA-specific exonuclease RecJ [Thermoflexales bacterium]MCS7324550.1 single-stranded-DNA-specific exonuclease RecJ [Thermoflexales bacterium]MDW8054766.1 single-stranded-DNA-specific exonuclease RecJ [Anaerolineae bacterium]MDW8292525.1 single-stranded-DNA-specific exonuclease RecJ [Anaerolineae bacterium]